MNIAGVGVVWTRGRGLKSLEQGLEEGWKPPVEIEVPFLRGRTFPVYPVSSETLSDRSVLSKLRRGDKFSKMAVLAACDAWSDSGMTLKEDVGIILATGLGPHGTTFRFIDEILQYGDAGVSPTAFSSSVHNAAASYIAETLKLRGPILTVTQFQLSFHQALLVADAWLSEDRCKSVLVGAVDELGEVMEYVFSQKIPPAVDGRIRPFVLDGSAGAIAGEGSAFFLMTREETPQRYGVVLDVDTGPISVSSNASDLVLWEFDGLSERGHLSLDWLHPGSLIASVVPLFGSFMTGSALHCATAALMLRSHRIYDSPVKDNPQGLPLAQPGPLAEESHIAVIRMDCGGQWGRIRLER